MRGPYCTTLAAAGFALNDFYEEIPKQVQNANFANGTIQKRLEKFTKFISKRENDVKFLEAAASLHFLSKTSRLSYKDAIERVVKKMSNVDKSYVGNVLDTLKTEGLL